MRHSGKPRVRFNPQQHTDRSAKLWVRGERLTTFERASVVRLNEEFNRLYIHQDSLARQITAASRKGKADKVQILSALLNNARAKALLVSDEAYRIIAAGRARDNAKRNAIRRAPLKVPTVNGSTRADALALVEIAHNAQAMG